MFLATRAALAAPAPGHADEAVANSERFLAVSGSPGVTWRYAEIAGYEVISDCSDEETNDALRSLIAGRQLDESLLLPGFGGPASYPSSVILYNPTPGSPAEEFATGGFSVRANTAWRTDFDEGENIPESRVGAVDRVSLCLELPAGATRGAVAGFIDAQSPVIPILLQEVPAFQVSHRVPEFPAWLVAGLTGPGGPLANGWQIRWTVPTHVVLPTALWVSNEETAYVRQHGRPRVKLIPAKEFFEGDDRTGPLAAAWKSEAGLFVRWGLYSRAYALGYHTRAFWDFVDRASGRPVDEAMFRKSFGFGYKELDSQLAGMLSDAVSNFVALQIDINMEPALPKLRNATPAEYGRIVGDWERAEGQGLRKRDTAVSAKLLAAAGATLQKAFAEAGQDPELSGALGVYEAQVGETDAAAAHLEAAALGHSRRPLVYLSLAQLRLKAAEAQPLGPGGRFNARQEEAVLIPLITARGLAPSMPMTYRVAARAMLRGAAKPTKEELSIMAEGRQLYWRDPVFGDLADRVDAMSGVGQAAGG